MRTAEELMKQLDALEPVADVDAWFDGLTPEERAALIGEIQATVDASVVPRSRFTEPHETTKQAAAERARKSVRVATADGIADVENGAFGAAFDLEDGSIGVLDNAEADAVEAEPTAAEVKYRVCGYGCGNGDWDQRRRFALLAAQRAREAFSTASDTIDVWGVKRSLKMALKAGLREGARRLFIWSERF